jgi:hypothetical protein
MVSSQRISIVLPVYNEHENIAACLRGLWSALREHDHEILVCYDFDEDTTLPAIAAMPDKPPSVRLVKNSLGRGAAFAIRAGFDAARGDVAVTTMADLCDPPEVIPRMAEKVRVDGADVVAGSRYMEGGSQSGGPWLKRTISRWVGYSMWWIANLGTHDATTNFRAYSKRFLDTISVESRTSFDIALELTVKAHLAGRKVSEVPSSWIDRTAGESRFRMWKWMPNYLRWYVRAMIPPVLVFATFAALFAIGWARAGRAETGAVGARLLLCAMASACAFVLWVARRVRGRTRLVDALHPLLWLLAWQLAPPRAAVPIAIAAASFLCLGFSCGWRRLVERMREPVMHADSAVLQADVGLCALFVVTWLASILLPVEPPAPGLDLSWSMSLAQALSHRMQFGRDVVFTFGPLGYFATGVVDLNLFDLKIVAFEGVFKALGALFLTLNAKRLAGPLDRSVYFLMLALLPLAFDSYALAIIACVTVHLMTNPRGNALVQALGLLVLAVISLIKFTFFAAIVPCMVAIAIARWIAVSRLNAAWIAATYLACCLGLWIACHQSILNIPQYLIQSMRVAGGYSEGESESGHELELGLGLAIVAIMLLLVVGHLGRSRERKPRALLALALASVMFVAFKTGFVRISDHTMFFFGWAAVAVFFIPPPSERAAWVSGACTLARQSCVGLALYGTAVGSNLNVSGLTGLFAASIDHMYRSADGMLDPSSVRAQCETTYTSAVAANALPKVRREVGDESIDMMSFEQGLLFLNDLRWTPRPVFQGYVTFTPELLRTNAAFFESERAPRYVLSKLASIDGRLPTMDDGLALQVVARRYRPVLVDADVVLLRRDPSATAAETPRVVMKRSCRFGERVEIGGLAGSAHVLKLDISYSAWGKLRTALLSAPPLYLLVRTEDGDAPPVRIVPGMMKTGALIDPWIDSQDRWIDWLSGNTPMRVASFMVDVPSSPAMYADSFDIEIASIEPVSPVADGAQLRLIDAPIFDPQPSEIHTVVAPRERMVDGKGVLLVQTPSRLRFDIPAAGSYIMTGIFGMLPEAYEMHATDGASFVAMLDDGGQKVVLFNRMLDPAHRTRDRGSQPLIVEFAARGPASVYLYANPGWNNNAEFDLAYWGALRIAGKGTR